MPSIEIFEEIEKTKQILKNRRYENGMTKPVFPRPGRNKSEFVPNNFREIQQRESFDVRYSPEEFSHFFGPANLNVTFDKQEEMDQEQFNYNLREAEREIRLLKNAAQSGNPFAQRELQNSHAENERHNLLELKRVKEQEEKRIKTSILEFEKTNQKSILEYKTELEYIADSCLFLIGEIQQSKTYLFDHYKQVLNTRLEYENLNLKYKLIDFFLANNKRHLSDKNSLSKIAERKIRISGVLYDHYKVQNLMIEFGSEINFRDTLSQLMTLQKEFIEAQVKYKAFPIYPNLNIIEMPKQMSQSDPFLNVYIKTTDSVPVQKVMPPRRVIC